MSCDFQPDIIIMMINLGVFSDSSVFFQFGISTFNLDTSLIIVGGES